MRFACSFTSNLRVIESDVNSLHDVMDSQASIYEVQKLEIFKIHTARTNEIQ